MQREQFDREVHEHKEWKIRVEREMQQVLDVIDSVKTADSNNRKKVDDIVRQAKEQSGALYSCDTHTPSSHALGQINHHLHFFK